MVEEIKGRRVIDARSTPIVITDLPLRPSTIAVRKETALALPQALPSGRPGLVRRRHWGWYAAPSLITVPIFGFILGALGVGEAMLVATASAVVIAIAALAVLTLTSGRGSAPHCPGVWHK